MRQSTTTTTTTIKMNSIFDRVVLRLVFTKLIELAKKEKGCEYAYECITKCVYASKRWRRVIETELRRHMHFPAQIKSANFVKTEINDGKFKLDSIDFGHTRLMYDLSFDIRFKYRCEMNQKKIIPTFYFEITPLHYPIDKNHNQCDYCAWCCIIYFNAKKKHGRKKCHARRKLKT